MAATPSDDQLRRGQPHIFHPEHAVRPAAVAGDREGREAARELLADEPMTPATLAYESDFLIEPANLEEKTF